METALVDESDTSSPSKKPSSTPTDSAFSKCRPLTPNYVILPLHPHRKLQAPNKRQRISGQAMRIRDTSTQTSLIIAPMTMAAVLFSAKKVVSIPFRCRENVGGELKDVKACGRGIPPKKGAEKEEW